MACRLHHFTLRTKDKLEAVKNYNQWYFGHYHVDKDIDEKHTALYQRIIPLSQEV